MPNENANASVLTPINVVRLAMWKHLGNNTYDTVMDFDNRFMSFTDDIASNSTPLYGCGLVTDSVVALDNGTLTYNIHAFKKEERNKIFDETLDTNGAVITTGKETIPYVVCAHADAMSNGHWNLYKYFKVKFQPNSIGTQQQSNGSTTFSTTSMTGMYIRDTELEMMRAIYYDVDPTTTEGAALINNWFTTATYIGGTV